jgi:thiaminase/transcriptional activator TenA
LFLIHFARANALACYKSDYLEDMEESAKSVAEIIDVERELHVKVGLVDCLPSLHLLYNLQACAGWGISKEELDQTPEARANMAYTRFVLEKGLQCKCKVSISAVAFVLCRHEWGFA